jgi:hypothetical protein
MFRPTALAVDGQIIRRYQDTVSHPSSSAIGR